MPIVRHSSLDAINVIYYHHVGDPAPHYKAFYNGCTAAKFAQDLECLSRVFDFSPLSEVLASKRGEESRGRPKLAVTFDDGFDLGNQGVMQIMEHYGVKATTFVITSCIGNRRMMWRHMLSAIHTLAPESVWGPQYNELAVACGFRPIERGEGLLAAARAVGNASQRRVGRPPLEAMRLAAYQRVPGREATVFRMDRVGAVDCCRALGRLPHAHASLLLPASTGGSGERTHPSGGPS